MYSNSVNAYNLDNFFVTLGDDVTGRTLRLSVFWERGLWSKERGSAQAYSELKGVRQAKITTGNNLYRSNHSQLTDC